jgi:aryl-alcohol dehydrogenase-like predicted oxidoreductase
MTVLAAVDCGTNSTRLLVCEDGRTVERLMVITRLGAGVDATGRLAPDAIDRTIDVLHRYRGVMDVFSEAKEKGAIRAHGCSCHSIEALRAASKSPWVEVDLARVNPIGSHMDANPATVVSILRNMKTSGKAVIGMKILGQGELRNRQDEAIRYALSLGVLDAFTIGAESKTEQEDLIQRIGRSA